MENWLEQNEEAKASVLRGIEQAKNGEFSDNPPDLEADTKLFDEE